MHFLCHSFLPLLTCSVWLRFLSLLLEVLKVSMTSSLLVPDIEGNEPV
jgi:hypothetical protein